MNQIEAPGTAPGTNQGQAAQAAHFSEDGMLMRKLHLTAGVILALCLTATAWANPGTSGALNGVEDIYTGALPPPGFYFMNYTLFYEADAIANHKGNDIEGTKVTMIADAMRFIYSSDINVLGGHLAWHTVIPLVHKDLKNGALKRSYSGVGDIYVSPFILGWHLHPENGVPTLHIAVGQDIIMPTGEFDKDELLPANINGVPVNDTFNPNIGTNHWTFESVFAVTKVYPKSGLVLDAKLMYDIHTEESKTDVKTGDQFHCDFAATMPILSAVEGDKITEQLRAGINGYYFTSLEKDEYKGTNIKGSKEKVFAIGPLVRYNFSERTSLTAKALFETRARNRPEGTAIWLKLVHAF